MLDKRKVSNKQEKRISISMRDIQEKSRLTINSGAFWADKSDISTEDFQIECKTKEKPSKQITIKKEWHDKIETEALISGKHPLLIYSFGDGKDYVAVDLKTFKELIKDNK